MDCTTENIDTNIRDSMNHGRYGFYQQDFSEVTLRLESVASMVDTPESNHSILAVFFHETELRTNNSTHAILDKVSDRTTTVDNKTCIFISTASAKIPDFASNAAKLASSQLL